MGQEGRRVKCCLERRGFPLASPAAFLAVASVRRELTEPSGRYPGVLTAAPAQPMDRIAQVVSAAKHDQGEWASVQHGPHLGIVANCQLGGVYSDRATSV